MSDLILNGEVYKKVKTSKDLRIVILQRGWVMIGIFNKTDNDCILTNAYVIRKWGTSYGLGELALEGKKEETILDKAGTVKFDYLTVVATLDCDITKWNDIYG